MCQALQGLLRAETWPNGTAPVFDTDSVRDVSQGDEIGLLHEGLIPPLCIISPLGGELDPEHGEEPTLVQRTIDITLVVINNGDRIGEAPIMGANRETQITSPGRGILEIEARLFDAVAKLNVQQGIIIQFAAFGMGQTRRDQNDNIVAIQDYTFRVWCSTTPEYEPVTAFAAAGHSGNIAYSWRWPAKVQSAYRTVVRVAAGSTPPASITAGTSVESITSWTSYGTHDTVTGVLAPGTWSMSVFITYDTSHVPPSADLISSAAATATVVVS